MYLEGGRVAVGDVAVGDVAGGDVAGGDVPGGDVAGGDVAMEAGVGEPGGEGVKEGPGSVGKNREKEERVETETKCTADSLLRCVFHDELCEQVQPVSPYSRTELGVLSATLRRS